MKQNELAKNLDITPQQISQIVQGKENLTLKTISKLSKALDIKLIEVPEPVHANGNIKPITVGVIRDERPDNGKSLAAIGSFITRKFKSPKVSLTVATE